MSLQVEQSSLIKGENHESDAGAVKAMDALKNQNAEEKPKIIIKAPDLNLVMDATHLSRNAAIELIESTNGDIKEALRKYVNDDI
ncbi:hypothetical protein M9Y10_002417 [Tritrichomonas musculus]|uniref:Nascent polypeptide-associated complex subunit alpha-like UBA domain-containing protein n=1 Tax=Tritrichomonas musculus TaxID=1915356 RepID=A0ABR2L9V3_9EUKA